MTALTILFGVLMFLTALFLILLVLVQRGRGGGLSGALGGMGGQSAFGTKAGDLFTRITIVVATFWILLCMAAILILNRQPRSNLGPRSETAEFQSVNTGRTGGTDKVQPGGAGAGPAEAEPDSTPPVKQK